MTHPTRTFAKRALQDAGISMPDEAREIVFPQAVPVRMLREEAPQRLAAGPRRAAADEESSANAAEGHLTTEADDVRRQAVRGRVPEGGENLLEA